MTSALSIRKQIKPNLLEALETAGELDYVKTIAEISLNTGFRENTVEKVLQQMIELNYITIKDGILKRPGK